MAHLAPDEVAARRIQASEEIIAVIEENPAREWFAIMCPCNIDCNCMPLDEVPRIRLSFCMYPGELDYFFTQQPFLNSYGTKVRWHCDECHGELDCGAPFLTE